MCIRDSFHSYVHFHCTHRLYWKPKCNQSYSCAYRCSVSRRLQPSWKLSVTGSSCKSQPIDVSQPINIKRFNNQSGQSEDIRFLPTSLKNKDSLQSNGIVSTLHDFEEIKTCYGSRDNCVDTQIIKNPKNLNICAPIASYRRDSKEAIAVNAALNIDTAYAFFDQIRGVFPSLPKAQLLVHPKKTLKIYEATNTSKLKETRVIENNLSISPRFFGLPTYIVYEKSKEAVENNFWNGAYLSDSLWALGHETGHLAFREIAFKDLNFPSALSHSSLGADIPTSVITGEPELTDLNGLPRSVKFYHEVKVINEAFADMYGLYVNSPTARSIDRINCFTKRDPTLATYYQGGPFKSLNQEVLDIFYSSTTQGKYDCNEPWFQDVHDMGQPIAYGIHHLFLDAVGNQSTNLGRRLLVWADNINKLVDANATVSLQDMVLEGLHAAEFDGRLTRSQCQTVKQVFPTYYQSWVSTDKIGC